MVGRRIGSWILEKELGRGGMGAVFEARHASLPRQAAVKVLSPGLESEETFRQRFQREAQLQAQLKHPNVAHVLDYLEDGGQWFLVIDYLERGSLGDLLARGEKVARQQAIAWARQALSGLQHAHQHGIVHRDIKPANLMLNAANEIVVMDFGIARGEAARGLTRTGMVLGTPQYMSPEQIMSPDRVDGRADIYSLGIVLYQLLAGRKPFDSGSEFSILQAQVQQPPPPLRAIDPSIPPELEAIVMRALAKSPEDRFADCDAMIRALDLASEAYALPRTVDLASPALPVDGTVQRTSFFVPAAPANPTLPSPSAARDRKRRSFQHRMLAGAATVLLVAAALAMHLAGAKTALPASPVSATGTSTMGTVVTVTSATATASSSPISTANSTAATTTTHAGELPTLSPGHPAADSAGMLGAPHVPPPFTNTTPPPPQPGRVPLPAVPQIAVIGMGGDPALAASSEQELERRLRDDYRVVDEHGTPEVDALLAKKDVQPATLGAQLLKSGFHILIVIRVESGDHRSFHFQGQEASLKSARVRLTAYLLPANRMIGPGWTELVEYTEASAEAKSKLLFIGATADLREAIDSDWKQLRAAAGGTS